MITTVIPPKISQYFDKTLLSSPGVKFQDDSFTLWSIYTYIKNKLMKRAMNHPIRMKKLKELEEEFLELYERAKKKEKDLEGKAENVTKRPSYRITTAGRNGKEIYGRFKYPVYLTFSDALKTYEIQEI